MTLPVVGGLGDLTGEPAGPPQVRRVPPQPDIRLNVDQG